MAVDASEEYPLAYRPDFEDPRIKSEGLLTLHILDMEAPHVSILPIALTDVSIEDPFVESDTRVTRVAHGVRGVGEAASRVVCTIVFDEIEISQHVVIAPGNTVAA